MKILAIILSISVTGLMSCHKDPIPVVFDSVQVLNITETTAIFNISFKEINVGHYSQGIVFSKSQNPTIENGKEGEFFSNPLDVSVGVSGLEPGTVYYMRAFAETSSGVFYGDTFSVKTLDPAWFTDSRDGQKYLVRNYSNKTWMIQNLNFRTKGSRFYMNDSTTYARDFGRLYPFDEALMACPSGWRMPTSADWANLFSFCGGSAELVFASVLEPGTRLWKKNPEVEIMNSGGFTIRPAGVLSLQDGKENFSERGWVSFIWSRSEDGNVIHAYSFSATSKKAFFEVINIKEKDRLFYSLRCIKEN